MFMAGEYICPNNGRLKVGNLSENSHYSACLVPIVVALQQNHTVPAENQQSQQS